MTAAAAEARLNALRDRLTTSPADRYRIESLAVFPASRLRVSPAQHDALRTLLRVLTAVSLLVLCAACFNVANFLIARATIRRGEMAVRPSVGATRWRLARLFPTERVPHPVDSAGTRRDER